MQICMQAADKEAPALFLPLPQTEACRSVSESHGPGSQAAMGNWDRGIAGYAG